ncbi:4725_t:CDS:2, partial [Cetraspora pellucida]
KKSLEEIASENDELSSKAQSLKDSEEIISNKKEEQHFFNLKSNIAMEHVFASNSFQDKIQNRLNKHYKEGNDSKTIRSINPQTNVSTVELNLDDSCISFVISGESYEQNVCVGEDYEDLKQYYEDILDLQTDFEEKDELTKNEFEK